jgi:iron complex transport system ATP-binding protein
MIEIANLSISLADKPILENYTLEVGRGNVLAILGANGVGKTTLLNCIAGLRQPSAGHAVSRGRIGYVPQLFHSTFAFSGDGYRADGPGALYRPLWGAPRAGL